MSGVLDRMAQRALGTLPAVRPPMAPRYTETSRPATAELEITAETEAIAPIPARKSDARKQLAVGSEREMQAQGDSPIDGRRILNSSATRKRIDNAPEQEVQVSAPADRGQRQPLPIERASQPGAGRNRDFAAEHSDTAHPAADLRPAEAINRSQAAPAAKATPHLERMEPHNENAEPMREMREASDIGNALVPINEPSRPALTAHSDSPKSSRSVAAPPLQIDRRTTPREPQPAQPVEEKTEIHISIGSIELRAPRVEPSPQPASFRPRVTLDDFLRRRQETRP